jgi:hypothetical protein
VVGADGDVRVIPPRVMPGRLTGTARHLTDPANKVYYATMEEGLYEVDVRTLDVTGLIRDGNRPKPGQTEESRPALIESELPGYHGKGLYTGQGRVVYANNGERDPRAKIDPTIPSGALAEWMGEGDWRLIRRNQFTEVTGPGGLEGNRDPAADPVWSIGWDHRSLILMLLDGGAWRAYRLPKASHTYDGSHGWNTEWPRIRDIGESDWLMTMHGTFWRFPPGFAVASSDGIAPRSTYLKVIGDFCRWNDRLVFGCDDTAKSEFLNKRRLKGDLAGPGQSQSNLWFLDPADLDRLGPALGRGAVWLDDPVAAGISSDPYLFGGYAHRSLHLSHDSSEPVTFTIEVDAQGGDEWRELATTIVSPRGVAWMVFTPAQTGAWVRVRADRDCAKATAFFHYRGADSRDAAIDPIFEGLVRPGDDSASGGLVYARGANLRTLRMVRDSGDDACWDLDGALRITSTNDPAGAAYVRKHYAIPAGAVTADAASAVVIGEDGRRWRFPKGDPAFDEPGVMGLERVCREVATERDLLNIHGTFYELPAENAGGVVKVRPIATHNRRIKDYASYRGMLVMTGLSGGAGAGNPRIVRSPDGAMGVWLGTIDDLWKFGKPRGRGGPWNRTDVKAGEPSDPYLMTGYDRKSVELSHDAPDTVTIRLEADIAGTGAWTEYRSFPIAPGRVVFHEFPDAWGAYWIRAVIDTPCRATVALIYD